MLCKSCGGRMESRKCEACGAALAEFDTLPLLTRFALDPDGEPLLEARLEP